LIKNIFIPKLGMTMEKGTIAEWVAKDGDQVSEGQVVLVLDTEKVSHEVEAPGAGILAVFGKEGIEYPCGAIVGIIAETPEEYESVTKNPIKYIGGQEGTTEQPASQPETIAPPQSTPAAPAPAGRVMISPVARQLAKTQQIDIAALSGSGPEGRIIKRDVEQAIQTKQQKPAALPVVPSPAPVSVSVAPGVEICAGKRVKSTIPLTGMRKKISDNLHLSSTATARVSGMFEFDVTELVKLREHYASKAETLGCKIAYTDLFVYMIAKAIKRVPIINSSIVGQEIKIWDDINIGLAVSIMRGEDESGLVVPVIRNADQMTITQICKARTELSAHARTGTLSMNQMTGGTFTYSNTGSLGGYWTVQAPLVNYPEAAILSTSAIIQKPVFKNGEIVVRPILPVSISFDHRIMDAAPPAKFIGAIAEMIEDPWMIMV
jgi:pyruvate dehydrogenase E2 component (dihydrolipoamide acetyltransferase)